MENKIGDESRERNFILLGIGAEYHIAQTELYGNYSEATDQCYFLILQPAQPPM